MAFNSPRGAVPSGAPPELADRRNCAVLARRAPAGPSKAEADADAGPAPPQAPRLIPVRLNSAAQRTSADKRGALFDNVVMLRRFYGDSGHYVRSSHAPLPAVPRGTVRRTITARRVPSER